MKAREIRRLRKATGLTQLPFAQRAHISPMKLSLLECGHVKATPEDIEAIRRVVLDEARRRRQELQQILGDAELAGIGVNA
ncbi:MAG TPA: helix-turn-helix transcriptional regulator [Terriglobales bacterium]|jgi:transcriptional regulator with XRE-family HTH domain|nr:helix-turn-helix transcriptional regulator [Terriglobales bacterium]